MAFNSKRNRLYLLLIGAAFIILAIISAYKSGKVTNVLLLFYLIGILCLLLQQVFRIHAMHSEIKEITHSPKEARFETERKNQFKNNKNSKKR